MSKSIKQWAKDAHENSRAHGWYEGVEPGDTKLVPEKLCLIHSEVSEALEAYRGGADLSAQKYETPRGNIVGDERGPDGKLNKPVGFDSELADIIIRVFDLSEHLGIDIERAIEEKHEYNKSRPHRHGGKVC